jgi:dienelactone hydrolase
MPDRFVSRRGLLLGGLAAGLLAGCGSSTTATAGTTVSGSFVSAHRRGVRTGWTLNYPPGHDRARLRVLIALHGRGENHTDAFGAGLHLDHYLAQAVAHGSPAFAVAAVDGGDHDYWHPRSASDTAAMVADEFVPLLGAHGLDVTRIGLLGWSMGGYGALYLSTVLRSSKVAVTVAESPALWHYSYQSAAGAFDDAADFDAHSIFGHLAALHGIPLRIDCGSGDGFAPVTRDLRAALSPTPAGGIEPGGHDMSYWRSQASAQLAFVGQHINS